VAAGQRILAFDFGASSLKLAEFTLDGRSVALQRYLVKELGLDPNKEQEHFPAVMQALQSGLAEGGLAPGPCVIGLSGQFAFTRFVKLPPVAPDQIGQMIGFEAKQNVPFPINEVVWDYQMLGSQSGEIEGLIVAIKKELVEQAYTASKLGKLGLRKVDVTPLALINAFLYNYPDMQESALLMDIGAKSTSLVFIEPGRVFCRVVPIGGHLVSQNISNEFQEPYVAAELLKKGKGYVGLGGAYRDPDDVAAARISKITRGVYSRLHAEVSRSISFYRNQQKGNAPRHVFLTGGTSALPYSDLFFKEKLNLPVSYFNPFRNVTLGPAVDRNRLSIEAAYLGPVVGLALREMGNAPVEINLEPASLREAQSKKSRMPMLAMALFFWFLMFAVIAGINFFQGLQIQSEIDGLQADLNSKTKLSKEIGEKDKQAKQIEKELRAVAKLASQRNVWPRLLAVLSEQVSTLPSLWITKVDMGAASTGLPVPAPATGGNNAPPQTPPVTEPGLVPTATGLMITGLYENVPGDPLSTFVENLKQSGMFSDVRIETRETLLGGDEQIALQFRVRADFKDEFKPDLTP
jgi:type IV pilus assembly protein PilM